MKKILVLKEKGGNIYYDASTDEALHQVCIDLVRRRYDEKIWYSDLDEEPEPEVPELSEDQAETLPQSARDAIIKDWSIYKSRMQILEDNETLRNILRKALSGDGNAAYHFLNMRESYEHEAISVENIQEIVVLPIRRRKRTIVND